MIKTWKERIEPNSALGPQLVAMQAEIDELRAMELNMEQSENWLLTELYAARWRYWRNKCSTTINVSLHGNGMPASTAGELDAETDAAIKREQT